MPQENPYIQQTNADAAQFFAQQNLANQQNRGGGGGGGNSLQEIMTGNQFQHGLDQKAADADLARKQQMAKLNFSQDMELRKVDAANAGINQERANQYAQSQEATQNANAMARQAQQNTFASEEQLKEHKRSLDTFAYQQQEIAKAQLRVQLAKTKQDQNEDDATGSIRKEIDDAEASLYTLQKQSIKAGALFASQHEGQNEAYTQNIKALESLKKAKDERLAPISIALNTRGKFQDVEVSAITAKTLTDFLSIDARPIPAGDKLNRLGEWFGEFGSGDPTVKDAEISSKFQHSPDIAQGLLTEAANYSSGALRPKLIENAAFKTADTNSPAVRALRSKITNDLITNALDASGVFVVADKVEAQKQIQSLMNNLQGQIGNPIASEEDINTVFKSISPLIDSLSLSLFGNQHSQAEVVDFITNTCKNVNKDSLILGSKVTETMGAKDSLLGYDTVVTAGLANVLKEIGKNVNFFKTITKGKYLTTDDMDLMLGNLNKADGDVNQTLQDPEVMRIMDLFDSTSKSSNKMRGTLEAKKALALQEKTRKAKEAEDTLDITNKKDLAKTKLPGARKTARSQNEKDALDKLIEIQAEQDKKPIQ